MIFPNPSPVKHFLRAPLLLGGLLLAGCDKPDEGLVVCEPEAASVASMAAFHRLFAPPVQLFQASTSQAQTLTLLDGSFITVPAGAFALPSGTPATGTAQLRVQLLTKPSAMALGGLPSQTFWRPLEGRGQFRITAWQNGGPLRLRPGFHLTVNVRLDSLTYTSGQQTWSGIGVGSGSLNTTWIQDTARVGITGTAGGQRYFRTRVYTDTLGWYQVGQLWTSNPADTTLLRADVGGDAATRVYLLPTQRSGAFLMKWNSQTRLMELYGVPAGSALNVVTLRTQNNQLQLAIERVTVRRGLVLRPAPVVVSPDQAAAQIEQL